jgi:hypothetical protein
MINNERLLPPMKVRLIPSRERLAPINHEPRKNLMAYTSLRYSILQTFVLVWSAFSASLLGWVVSLRLGALLFVLDSLFEAFYLDKQDVLIDVEVRPAGLNEVVKTALAVGRCPA